MIRTIINLTFQILTVLGILTLAFILILNIVADLLNVSSSITPVLAWLLLCVSSWILIRGGHKILSYIYHNHIKGA